MDRERLTITLRKDILRRLDALIDGITLRNRSHAIETFLEKALTAKVDQAVVLAGGQGTNMRPLTLEVPKALIPVRGKPILEYVIEMLRDHGIRTVVLCIGHMGDKIKNHVGDGSKYGVKIIYSEEKEPMGTAGAIRQAKSYLQPQPFLVMHGDVLAQIDINEFIGFHQEQERMGTIALTTVSDTSALGSVKLRGSTVIAFEEKPKNGTSSHLVSAGIYMFEPEILDQIPEKGAVMLEDIFATLAKEGRLAGFPFEGLWFDVSTPESYERAIKEWK